jgi:hypothetical protein
MIMAPELVNNLGDTWTPTHGSPEVTIVTFNIWRQNRAPQLAE